MEIHSELYMSGITATWINEQMQSPYLDLHLRRVHGVKRRENAVAGARAFGLRCLPPLAAVREIGGVKLRIDGEAPVYGCLGRRQGQACESQQRRSSPHF